MISVIWCIARCLCCGVECCCGCLSCCNACCPSGRRRERSPKYADNQAFQPSPYQGYQPTPAPPAYGAQPQFAQFDVSRQGKVNEDALPAMPSWAAANSTRVAEEHKDGDVELGRLDPMQEQRVPLVANQAPPPRAGYDELDSNSPGLPYQQYGAYNGGDLGNPYGRENLANSPRPYERFSNNNLANQQQGYRNTPSYQPSYSAYSSSQSTRYEPSSIHQQETGISSGVPPARKPVQDSWREV